MSDVFEFVEAPLDGVATAVDFKVVGNCLLSGRIARNDCFGTYGRDEFAQSPLHCVEWECGPIEVP